MIVRAKVVSESKTHIAVLNHGSGIPALLQHRVFEAFDRLGAGGEKAGGAGIGLAISKRLAQLRGGEIGFSSKPDEATEVWIEPPIASQAE